VKSNPPKVEGICDKCGSKAIQREDETEEAISHRLATYNEKTAPLIGFYEKEGLVLTVEAVSSDAVIEAVKKELNL
jgi:adenylate kinase